jgi:hypothetical protein
VEIKRDPVNCVRGFRAIPATPKEKPAIDLWEGSIVHCLLAFFG